MTSIRGNVPNDNQKKACRNCQLFEDIAVISIGGFWLFFYIWLWVNRATLPLVADTLQ